MVLEHSRSVVGSKPGLEHSRPALGSRLVPVRNKLVPGNRLELDYSRLALERSTRSAGSRNGGDPLRHCWMT